MKGKQTKGTEQKGFWCLLVPPSPFPPISPASAQCCGLFLLSSSPDCIEHHFPGDQGMGIWGEALVAHSECSSAMLVSHFLLCKIQEVWVNPFIIIRYLCLKYSKSVIKKNFQVELQKSQRVTVTPSSPHSLDDGGGGKGEALLSLSQGKSKKKNREEISAYLNRVEEDTNLPRAQEKKNQVTITTA